MRFLRFLRNDFSVKTSDGNRWLHQVNDAHAQSKSSKLLSLCSTQPHIKGFLDKPLPTSMGRETLVCRGSCNSSPESENRVCTHNLLRQLRKKRIKRRKEPVWRSS